MRKLLSSSSIVGRAPFGAAAMLLSAFALLAIASATPAAETVVARVNEISITERDVDRLLAHMMPARGESKAATTVSPALREQAVAVLIDRELVLAFLERSKLAASQADIDLVLAGFTRQLESQGRTLAEHLKSSEQSLESLRRQLLWSESWKKYVARQTTDANLEKYFLKRKRDFDGTKVQVAHLRLALAADATADEQTKAMQRLRTIKQSIDAGEITFAAACEQYSEAPSAKSKGLLGWIGRFDSMPEPFASAAFALEVGQTSEPIVSSVGVQLVHVVAIEPGKRTWQESREELAAAMVKYLFRWIADHERPQATIVSPAKPAAKSSPESESFTADTATSEKVSSPP